MKLKSAAGFDNLHPIFAQALAPFVQPERTDRNLDCIRWNLGRAEARAAANPTQWNVSQAESLREAEADYLRFLDGEIQHRDMCFRARELSTTIPAWGTYGT